MTNPDPHLFLPVSWEIGTGTVLLVALVFFGAFRAGQRWGAYQWRLPAGAATRAAAAVLAMRRVVKCIGELVTGEWMFWWGCPNGGGIIFWRTLQVTALLYIPSLALRSYLEAGCATQLGCHLDWGAVLHDHAETVKWLGAIFAGVYAALYARFASQWSYLAGVYNQIRQTMVTKEDWTSSNAIHMELWKAGFVEDALDLHLATKPAFGPFLLRLLEDRKVQAKFDDFAFHGPDRGTRLRNMLIHKGFAREKSEPDGDEVTELAGAVILSTCQAPLLRR